MSKSKTIIQNRHLTVKMTDYQASVYIDDHLDSTWEIIPEFGKDVIANFKDFYDALLPHMETMSDYERALKYAPMLWHLK